MSSGHPAFDDHPVSFQLAMQRGLVRAAPARVIDGDTAARDTADFLRDLGWHTYTYARVRLLGVDTLSSNAGELHGTTGRVKARAFAAKDRVAALLKRAPVLVRSYKDRKTFDRFVAEIWIPATRKRAPEGVELLELGGTRWWSLADMLLMEKLAKPYVG